MAACTRLERLNYKEISVPSWKKIDKLEERDENSSSSPFEKRPKFSLSPEEEDIDITSTNSPVKLLSETDFSSLTKDDFYNDCSLNEAFEKKLLDYEELEKQRFARLEGGGTGAQKVLDLNCLSLNQSINEIDDNESNNSTPNIEIMNQSISNKMEQDLTLDVSYNLDYDNTPYCTRTFPIDEATYEEMKEIDCAITSTPDLNRMKFSMNVSGARMDFVSSDEEEDCVRHKRNKIPNHESQNREVVSNHVTIESSDKIDDSICDKDINKKLHVGISLKKIEDNNSAQNMHNSSL